MKTPTVVFLDEISICPNAETFVNMLRIMNIFDQINPETKEKLQRIAQAGQPIVFCNNNA